MTRSDLFLKANSRFVACHRNAGRNTGKVAVPVRSNITASRSSEPERRRA